MFATLSRDDRGAEKAASAAAASLKTQLSRLLLHDMLTLRAQVRGGRGAQGWGAGGRGAQGGIPTLRIPEFSMKRCGSHIW